MNLNSMNQTELGQLCKSLGIKNYSKLTKSKRIELLIENGVENNTETTEKTTETTSNKKTKSPKKSSDTNIIKKEKLEKQLVNLFNVKTYADFLTEFKQENDIEKERVL